MLDFNAVLGRAQLGTIQLGQSALDTVPPASFLCESVTSLIFDAIVQSDRFECNFTTSIEFVGQPHLSFHVDAVSGRLFGSTGTLLSDFTCNFTSGRDFIDSAVDSPSFDVDSVTDVQFFVRGGQSPDCYYDNAAIIADSTRNYVF